MTRNDPLAKLDVPPPLRPPYTNDLARRLIAHIRAKNSEGANGKRGSGKRFSLRKLAARSGLTYRAITHYIISQDQRMSADVMDSLMYGLGINVLDLLQPSELAAKYDSYDRQVRYHVRQYAEAAREATSGESPSTDSTKTVPPDLTNSLDIPPDTV